MKYLEPGRAYHAYLTACDDMWPPLDDKAKENWARQEQELLFLCAAWGRLPSVRRAQYPMPEKSFMELAEECLTSEPI